jgi:putative ABC transport system ATP-binding protein
MIRFENVTVSYGDATIIKNVSFHIREGERAVFYGKSGSGKSTVLTTVVGAHVPSEGTVSFRGTIVDRHTVQEVRRSVSFIGQEPVLGAERISDALLLPYTYRSNRGKTPQRERILKILDVLHLEPDILERDAARVSGGEKQRIAIARSLLLDKCLFLLDEVTSALDVESKRAVLDLFSCEEYTIISVSHDPDWFDICSRFIRIADGEIAEISDKPDTSAFASRQETD